MKWPTAAAWKAGADAARDWAAVLYTPILTGYAVWLTCLLVWAWPWKESTEPQRLNFLGLALIGALMLIGLGTLFYQRRTANVKAKAPGGGELDFTSGESPAPPAVTTTTTTTVAPADPPAPS